MIKSEEHPIYLQRTSLYAGFRYMPLELTPEKFHCLADEVVQMCTGFLREVWGARTCD